VVSRLLKLASFAASIALAVNVARLAWPFWRAMLEGPQGRPLRDDAYGVRLIPLSAAELAAARVLEDRAWRDPDAFAEATG